MVYDCFQFFNELDMLYIRMKVLNDVVDRFVVSE
ncbi:MAG: glycosyl transferase GT17 family protein, partial [Lachnospiraceae bacterium]|nr:glycosyl transferase GT17 family protein [Lachnospiraceae bacterium]